MDLYETGEKTLRAQIEHWSIVRKQYVLMYYARKEGYKQLGLQPLPTLTIAEYKAKEAINQLLLLQSLQKSQFANEEWTLSETSAELTLTAPRNTFKKQPYVVDVWFDHEPSNSFPYTNWEKIYYQDVNDHWHVAEGKADINGLYYDDYLNERIYFVVFAPDVDRYSTTGQWTVKFKNETLSSVNSSQRSFTGISLQGLVTSSRDATRNTTSNAKTTTRRDKNQEGVSSSTTPPSPDLRRGRRRRAQQGESPSGRRPKRVRTEASTAVSAGEVGRRSTTVPRRGLTRTERLAAEARDPPIIILQGGANNLKCWRNRHKDCRLCLQISTVFRWAGLDSGNRMLIAFTDVQQRSEFLKTVNLPKGCTFAKGSLEAL